MTSITNYPIKKISQKQAKIILNSRDSENKHYLPYGLFWLKENGKFIAIDNSDGCAWVEEFKWKEECFKFLKGLSCVDAFGEVHDGY